MIIIDPWLNLWFGLPLLPSTPSGNGMFLGASRDFWILLVTCAARLQVIRTSSRPCFHGWTSSRSPTQPVFFEIPCSIGTFRNIISREHPSRKVSGSCLAQNLTLVNVGAKYHEPSLLYIMNNNLDQHGGSHSDEERFLLASSGYAPFPPVISPMYSPSPVDPTYTGLEDILLSNKRICAVLRVKVVKLAMSDLFPSDQIHSTRHFFWRSSSVSRGNKPTNCQPIMTFDVITIKTPNHFF